MTTLLVGDSYSDPVLFYRSRFLVGDPFACIEHDGKRTIIVSQMEASRARHESSADDVRSLNDFGYQEEVKQRGDRLAAFTTVLVRALQELGASSVTVPGTFPIMYANGLTEAGIELRVEPNLFQRERRQKSAVEIAAIEETERATEQAMAAAIELIARSEDRNGVLQLEGEPLTSERVHTELAMSLLRQGVEMGDAIVACGPRGATDPHWVGSGPLRARQPIVIDVYPRSKSSRYHSDMTRTVIRGEATDALRRMYETACRATDAAIAELRPGADARRAHEAAVAVFTEAGYSGEDSPVWYLPGTGHGVGLSIHEMPVLGTVEMELLEGDVITVEPGLFDNEVGQTRIEDVVVVTSDGPRNLTNFPRQFEI